METSGIILEKFIRFITNADCLSDEMYLPSKILSKYGSRIQDCFLLKFRNGYEIPVVFHREEGVISGLSTLYEDFELEPGQMLVFEFDGSYHFNVYGIGTDFSEIEYPQVVHHLQQTRPRDVNVKKEGLKFVNFVKDEEPLFDEFEPPRSFRRTFPMLMGYQNFFFSNGKRVEGGYHHHTKNFHGLSKFCSIVGLENFSGFNLLLFNYENSGITTVSVFDDHFVEHLFPGTPVSTGLNSHNPVVRFRIEITIQAHHLYRYIYGVDISTEHYNVTAYWKKKDYINIYSGDKAWRLQVRSRGGKSRRTTIHDGWIQFRDDLGLRLGDVVVLEGADNFRTHFGVQVMRNDSA